jgi:hypothetical protein
MGPNWAQMTLGRSAQVDLPSLFLGGLGPIWIGFLQVIDSPRVKIQQHPSTGSRRNLGESDEAR